MAKAYGGALGGVSGKVGNLVFYRYRGRDYVRAAPRKIGKKKFNHDPRYANTRKNAAEFSRAGKAVKLIHGIMQRFGFTAGESSSHWRLQSRMMEVIKADTSNEWGMRNVPEGNLARLERFSFLEKPGKGYIHTDVDHYNPNTGVVHITVRLSLFDDWLNAEIVSGSCKVSALAMAIDFYKERFNAVLLDGGTVEFAHCGTQVKLRGDLKADAKVPLLVVTRIQSDSEYNKPDGSSRYDMLMLSNVV